MLFVVAGLVTLVLGLNRRLQEAGKVRYAKDQVVTLWKAYEKSGHTKEALHKWTRASDLRAMREEQLLQVTDQTHTVALFGLLFTGIGLTGLWLCTNREVKDLRDTRPPAEGSPSKDPVAGPCRESGP